MIDLSLEEMLALAREAELQQHLEADGILPSSATYPLIPELSVVVTLRLAEADEGHEVPAGSRGTVVSVYGQGEAYLVEFADPPGLAEYRPADLEVVTPFGDPVAMPEDLRGKLAQDHEGQRDDASSNPSVSRD